MKKILDWGIDNMKKPFQQFNSGNELGAAIKTVGDCVVVLLREGPIDPFYYKLARRHTFFPFLMLNGFGSRAAEELQGSILSDYLVGAREMLLVCKDGSCAPHNEMQDVDDFIQDYY